MKAPLSRLFYRIRYSIGFYPTIISIAYFSFALAIVVLPSTALWDFLKPLFEWTILPRVFSDKAVLATLITGIISFVALSFTMVMVVLSNVSTSFSPKLVLGLVTEKPHQIVLGNYIGSILYCLTLLLLVSNVESHRFHDIAIIFGAAMGIWCLVLFIYFIHNISASVQINSIVEKVYNETKNELYKRQEAEKTAERHRQESVDEEIMPRFVFPSKASGYLQTIDADNLVEIANEHDLVIRIYPHSGDFVIADTPFMACTKPYEEIEPSIRDSIYDNFTFFPGEKIEINARYGLTQLMEIAVKALSPGINDPGTACICIDYLTDLLILWDKLEHSDVYYDEYQNPRLIIRSLGFESLFELCMGPIRRYGKGDLLIANTLLRSFSSLSYFDREEKRYKRLLNDEAASVIEGMKGSRSNEGDRGFLQGRILEMNEATEDYFNLPPDLIAP